MKKGIRMALALGSSLVVWVSASASPVAISAATVHTFHFRLEGAQVAPSVNTDGTGWCTVTLDDVTGDVTVTGEYACMSGNITGVHIHGPAARGQSAGIIVPLDESGGSSGTISGGGTLTPQEIQDMLNGLTYVNVHSFAGLTGEIRGQIEACATASATTSNGGGTNPMVLSTATAPVLGTSWSADLDCAGHAPAVAALWFYARPSSGVTIGAGEILLRLSGKRLQKSVLPHSGNVVSFTAPIPNDTSLCGLRVYAQGVIVGSPGVGLSNRLDLVLGL
jgi:hypothetical protein